MTDKVSLHQYGNSFQAKLIASLLTNRQFLEQIQDILEPKFFESDSNNWLCKEIKKYFNKYKKLPTLDALKVIIDNDTEDILRVSIGFDFVAFGIISILSSSILLIAILIDLTIFSPIRESSPVKGTTSPTLIFSIAYVF